MHLPMAIFHYEYLKPSTLPGALVYLAVFAVVAFYLTRVAKLAFTRLIARDHGRMNHTVLIFLGQFITVVIYVLALVFYVRLVPALADLGNTLLASVSIVSVVIGLAAQPTLGNMVSGVALLLYRPFEVGDRVLINIPGGTETAVIESLTLGYTRLRTADNRCIIVPNSVMAGQTVVNVSEKRPTGSA